MASPYLIDDLLFPRSPAGNDAAQTISPELPFSQRNSDKFGAKPARSARLGQAGTGQAGKRALEWRAIHWCQFGRFVMKWSCRGSREETAMIFRHWIVPSVLALAITPAAAQPAAPASPRQPVFFHHPVRELAGRRRQDNLYPRPREPFLPPWHGRRMFRWRSCPARNWSRSFAAPTWSARRSIGT